jgi:hypothetical protein
VRTYSKSYDEKRYELLVSIDEEMKRIRVNANALINAEDANKNRQTVQKITDFCANIQALYAELCTLEESSRNYSFDDEHDDDNNGFGTGMDFFGIK